MPVGRFREDPRHLGAAERAVHARQYPEGMLVVGTLFGTVVRISFQYDVLDVATVVGALEQVGIHADLLTVSPQATAHALSIVGVVVGGVLGYLLGYAYREWKVAAVGQSGSGPGGTASPANAQSVGAGVDGPDDHEVGGE